MINSSKFPFFVCLFLVQLGLFSNTVVALEDLVEEPRHVRLVQLLPFGDAELVQNLCMWRKRTVGKGDLLAARLSTSLFDTGKRKKVVGFFFHVRLTWSIFPARGAMEASMVVTLFCSLSCVFRYMRSGEVSRNKDRLRKQMFFSRVEVVVGHHVLFLGIHPGADPGRPGAASLKAAARTGNG